MKLRTLLSTVLIVLSLLLVACASTSAPSATPTQPVGTPTVSAPLLTPTPAPEKTAIVPPPPTPKPTPIQPVPFSVTSIDMSVSPSSIAGSVCGTYLTVTYTAIFHAPANSTGGSVVFGYTVNGGRSGGASGEMLDFAPGQTSESFNFMWSGNLPLDHTYPGLGQVLVSSPNVLNSPSIKPTGACV